MYSAIVGSRGSGEGWVMGGIPECFARAENSARCLDTVWGVLEGGAAVRDGRNPRGSWDGEAAGKQWRSSSMRCAVNGHNPYLDTTGVLAGRSSGETLGNSQHAVRV